MGIIGYALTGNVPFKLDGMTIRSLIENSANLSAPAPYAAMATGMVLCAAKAVLCRFAMTYFKNELADGTPFTLRGSKELQRLGILTIAFPLGAAIVCTMGIAIADNFYPGLDKMTAGDYTSAGVGIMVILLSIICRYGAELTEGSPNESGPDENGPEDEYSPPT